MSYLLNLVAKRPVGLWSLDSNTITDHSGFNNNGLVGGTRAAGYPVASGMSNSSVVNNDYIISVPHLGFLQPGNETKQFSLVANIRVFSRTLTFQDQQLLSNHGVFDGLSVNGTKIKFTILYQNAADCTVEYDLGQLQRANVVATYSPEKISLWVNGFMVAEKETTPEQRLDKFKSTVGNYFTMGGAGLPAQQIMVNGVALFPRVLSGTEIVDINTVAFSTEKINTTPNMYQGKVIDLYDTQSMIFLEETYDIEDEWALGTFTNTAVVNDQVVPTFNTNISQAGNWIANFNLDIAETNIIFGVDVDWAGKGVLVQASIDGTNWETCTPGKNLGITNDIDPTDKILLIKASFAGGTELDESNLSSLRVTGYSSNVIEIVNDRNIEMTNPIDLNPDYPVTELQDNWGVRINPGGKMIIRPTPESYNSIEIWYKTNNINSTERSIVEMRIGDLANPTFAVINGQALIDGPYNYYVNGVDMPYGTTLPPSNVWTVVHISGNRNLSEVPIYINAKIDGTPYQDDIQIGRIVTYDYKLSAADVANVYKSYTGQKLVRAIDNSSAGLTESATDTTIYAYDWTILGSG